MGADPIFIGNYRKQPTTLFNVLDQFNQKLSFRNVRHFIEHGEKNERALRFFLEGLIIDENGVQHRIGGNPAFLDEIPAWQANSHVLHLGDYDLTEKGKPVWHKEPVVMNADFEKFSLPGGLKVSFRESYFMISGLGARYWNEDEKAFAFCMAKMTAIAFGGNLCFFTYDSLGAIPYELVFDEAPEGYQPGMALEEILNLPANRAIQPVRF